MHTAAARAKLQKSAAHHNDNMADIRRHIVLIAEEALPMPDNNNDPDLEEFALKYGLTASDFA